MLINHKAIDYKIIFSPLTSGPSFLFCQKSTVFSLTLCIYYSPFEERAMIGLQVITPHTCSSPPPLPPILLNLLSSLLSLLHTHKYIYHMSTSKRTTLFHVSPVTIYDANDHGFLLPITVFPILFKNLLITFPKLRNLPFLTNLSSPFDFSVSFSDIYTNTSLLNLSKI